MSSANTIGNRYARQPGAVQNDLYVSSGWPRAALSHRICTGMPRRRLGTLIAELAPAWVAQQESRLRVRRGGAGCAPKARALIMSCRSLTG
jgi:hypothetical protein